MAVTKPVILDGGILKQLGENDRIVGLDRVDNTSDANKPISAAQQAALNAKAPTANPSFTGTAYFGPQSNSEGAEIQLGKAPGNTAINGNTVNIDQVHNLVRIFEEGAPHRGVQLDLSEAPAGSKLWHSGNHNPANYAPVNNPAFGGNVYLPSFNGAVDFSAGTGDGASYNTYNTKMRVWWGLGLTDHTGTVTGFYDARAGVWDTKGGFRQDGRPVVAQRPMHSGWAYETVDYNTLNTVNEQKFINGGASTNAPPAGSLQHLLALGGGDSINRGAQLALVDGFGGELFFRVKDNSAWPAWKQALTTSAAAATYSRILNPDFRGSVRILANGAAGTGSLVFEGGTGSTMNGKAFVHDSYGSVIRWYEAGTPYRGFYVDLNECGSQSRLWHSGNLNPNNYATVNSPVFSGTVTSADMNVGGLFKAIGGVEATNSTNSIKSRINSGFYINQQAGEDNGWPGSDWHHLIANTHGSQGNYFSLQISASYFNNDNFYVRSTNNVGTTAWRKLWHDANFNPANYAPVVSPEFKNSVHVLSQGELSGGLFLGKAPSQSQLNGTGIIMDSYGSVLRWFESGTPFRGAILDFAKCGSQSEIYHTGNLDVSKFLSAESPTLTGNTKVADLSLSGTAHFGARTAQHIVLWGSNEYGFGVQNSTLYARTGSEFAIHASGSHSDGQADPGPGGTNLLRVSPGILQYKGQDIYYTGNIDRMPVSAAQQAALNAKLDATFARESSNLIGNSSLDDGQGTGFKQHTSVEIANSSARLATASALACPTKHFLWKSALNGNADIAWGYEAVDPPPAKSIIPVNANDEYLFEATVAVPVGTSGSKIALIVRQFAKDTAAIKSTELTADNVLSPAGFGDFEGSWRRLRARFTIPDNTAYIVPIVRLTGNGSNGGFATTAWSLRKLTQANDLSPSVHVYQRGQESLSANGILSVSTSAEVSWTGRIRHIGVGQGEHYSNTGSYEFTMPAVTTPIPIYGDDSVVSRTPTAGGIHLSNYQALYAIPTPGSQGSYSYAIVGFTQRFVVPPHWIRLVGRNSDNAIRMAWFNKVSIGLGESYDCSSTPATISDVANYKHIPAGGQAGTGKSIAELLPATVFNFGAVANGVLNSDGTATGTDNTDAFNRYFAYCRDKNTDWEIPPGDFNFSGSVTAYTGGVCKGRLLFPNNNAPKLKFNVSLLPGDETLIKPEDIQKWTGGTRFSRKININAGAVKRDQLLVIDTPTQELINRMDVGSDGKVARDPLDYGEVSLFTNENGEMAHSLYGNWNNSKWTSGFFALRTLRETITIRGLNIVVYKTAGTTNIDAVVYNTRSNVVFDGCSVFNHSGRLVNQAFVDSRCCNISHRDGYVSGLTAGSVGYGWNSSIAASIHYDNPRANHCRRGIDCHRTKNVFINNPQLPSGWGAHYAWWMGSVGGNLGALTATNPQAIQLAGGGFYAINARVTISGEADAFVRVRGDYNESAEQIDLSGCVVDFTTQKSNVILVDVSDVVTEFDTGRTTFLPSKITATGVQATLHGAASQTIDLCSWSKRFGATATGTDPNRYMKQKFIVDSDWDFDVNMRFVNGTDLYNGSPRTGFKYQKSTQAQGSGVRARIRNLPSVNFNISTSSDAVSPASDSTNALSKEARFSAYVDNVTGPVSLLIAKGAYKEFVCNTTNAPTMTDFPGSGGYKAVGDESIRERLRL